jgi:hypothetical protein
MEGVTTSPSVQIIIINEHSVKQTIECVCVDFTIMSMNPEMAYEKI